MCKVCSDTSKQDSCRVEKMGCDGCYYYKNIKEIKNEIKKEK